MSLKVRAQLVSPLAAAVLPRPGPGVLYLELDGDFFPAKNWSDRVLPVLGWWMENALALSYPGASIRNVFMDGPYVFTTTRVSEEDQLVVSLYGRSGEPLGDRSIQYSRYLASLRGAAKTVLQQARQLGFKDSEDLRTLETRLVHIERLEADSGERKRKHGGQ